MGHLARTCMQTCLLGGKLVHNVKGKYDINVPLSGPNFAHKSVLANWFFKRLHKRNRVLLTRNLFLTCLTDNFSLTFCGSCCGLMASAFVPGSSGLGSSPGQGHCVVFLSVCKTLLSQCLSPSLRIQPSLIRSRYYVWNARSSGSEWETAVFAGYLSPPRCINAWVPADCWGNLTNCGESDLRCTSIPSRASKNAPSQFMLQELG